MKLLKIIYVIVFTMTILVLLTGCTSKTKQNQTLQVVTAELKPNVSYLYYSGSIQPSKIDPITSPADGVIQKTYFTYGESVKKGQLLMEIISTKLQQDYHTALTDYIKAKDNYNQSIMSFNGTQSLYKAGIVDREDYLREKSTVANNELALITAKYALARAAKKVPNTHLDIESLSLEDINKIKNILNQQKNTIDIYAPVSGIALFPARNDNSNNDNNSNKTVGVGTEVKQGQIILNIGDMVGISTEISVDENHINQIKKGQQVTVTCSALPNVTFQGEILNVAAQAKASTGMGGGVANFAVNVIVPKITDAQRKLIRVGMDTKVTVTLKNPPAIMIPIDAVFEKNGLTMVTVQDAKTQKTQDVNVETGTTSQDQIVILNGLKPGDKVVVHDQTL